MFTALTYFLTSLTLACVIILTKSSGHEFDKSGEIFFYPRKMLKVLLFLSPSPFILALFVYLITKPRMSNLSLAILLFFGFLGFSVLFIIYVYSRDFRVKLTDNEIILFRKSRAKELRYVDISEVNFLDSGQSAILKIFSSRDKFILTLSSTLQDFDQLVEIVKSNAAKFNIRYRCRDKWGNWIQ